jgi:hypothetical protein
VYEAWSWRLWPTGRSTSVDAKGLEDSLGTDTRELEDLGGADDTTRENDLLVRLGRVDSLARAGREGNTRGDNVARGVLGAVEDDAGDLLASEDEEVGTRRQGSM